MAKKDALQKELDSLIKEVRKKHGEEAILDISDARSRRVPRFPIQSPAIADVLGPNPVEGGVPRGRIMELFGPESSGKTSLAQYLAAQIQNQNVETKDGTVRPGVVAFVDAEHAIDSEYASTFGLDMDKVLLSQPDSGEQALDIVEQLAASGKVDFIIVDSVAALTPRAEIEGEMGDQQMGLQARLMGKACRKLAPVIYDSMCTVLFINQIRMTMNSYGNPEVSPGGKALKFYASVRLEVRKIEFVTKKDEILGLKTRIKGVKNKTAPPMKKRELMIKFGKGFEDDREWVDYAISTGVIAKGGPWYTMPDGERHQGKESIYKSVTENPSIINILKEEVRKRIVPSGAREEVVSDSEQEESSEEDQISEELTIDE